MSVLTFNVASAAALGTLETPLSQMHERLPHVIDVFDMYAGCNDLDAVQRLGMAKFANALRDLLEMVQITERIAHVAIDSAEDIKRLLTIPDNAPRH